MRRASTASSVLAAMTGMAFFNCIGALSPATELRVENQTREQLDAMAAPCGQGLEAFAILAPGASRTKEVEPGCWLVAGWVGENGLGAAEVQVKEGALNRVPFHE